MLNIINNLWPFFEDNYRKIHVREYAKIQSVSPPTASKILEELFSEGILLKEVDKRYFYYFVNKNSLMLRDLQRTYWRLKLNSLVHELSNYFIDAKIILFGSIAKCELKEGSDIDLAVFSPSKKEIDLSKFEKNLGREIQLFSFRNLGEVPENLRNAILNGYLIEGNW